MRLKTIQYRMSGLDYIYVQVPVKKNDGEEYIDMPMGLIEKAIARKLIEARIPIRGMEVVFLRKTLGLYLKEWASEFGLTASGVLKWEKQPNVRLSKVNEAAVRSYVAEKLRIPINGAWSKLVAKEATPKKLSLQFTDAA